MKKKCVFLDRDGTINVEKNYLYKIEDFEYIPGVIEGLKILQEAGYLLVIVTNQSGIGRGYYTEGEFINLNLWMLNDLKKKGIRISRVYYCPHLIDAKEEKYRVACDCRKPAVGMFEKAIKELHIDINNSFVIGDKIRDCSICKITNCKGYLIGNNEKKEIIESVKRKEIRGLKYVSDLYSAAKEIIETELE